MERRKFTREFKLEAVRLIKDRGVSYVQASQDLSVHPSAVARLGKEVRRRSMRSRFVLVDLPEDGRRVINCTRFPAEQTARPTTYLSGKGEFRSWKNTNCCVGILRCSEPSSATNETLKREKCAVETRYRLRKPRECRANSREGILLSTEDLHELS